MEFTDDEIREELARLGYKDVPDDKLQEFKKDLLKLIQSERSKTNSLNSSVEERPQEKQSMRDTHKWREQNFEEDSDYLENITSKSYRPATAHAAIGRKNYAARSVGLFEQPLDLNLEDYEYQGYEKNNSGYYMPNPSYFDEGRAYSRCKSMTETTRPQQMKRKTARPTSCSDTDTAGVYELYERVRSLAMRDCECGQEDSKPEQEPPYRICGENRCPSVINPQAPPHIVPKTLPFKRHQMYMKIWKAQPAIGDDNRNSLRKEVQTRMLQKQEIKVHTVQRKVPKVNHYVPPPEKPRYKLRWDVRRANCNYEMPSVVLGQYYYCPDFCY